jgi:hypothetical protein
VYCFPSGSQPQAVESHAAVFPFRTWQWHSHLIYAGYDYVSSSWTDPQNVMISLSNAFPSESEGAEHHSCGSEDIQVSRRYEPSSGTRVLQNGA